jgi:hypothetical protein
MIAAAVQFGDALGHDSLTIGSRCESATGPQDGSDLRELFVGGHRPVGDDAGRVLGEVYVRQVLLGIIKVGGWAFACTYSTSERADSGAVMGYGR